jgi:hypothetical protein
MRALDRRGRRRFRILFIDLADLWGRIIRPLLGVGRG